jgi:hypothetical protein
MGKGDSRPSQPSAATRRSTEQAAAAEAAAVAPPGSGPARIPKSSTPPLTTSRTTTLDDPLTTSLLAEIARRPATVEMTPAQLAAARAMAPGGPESEHAQSADPDDHPDDPA